jgi:hypothetical protein
VDGGGALQASKDALEMNAKIQTLLCSDRAQRWVMGALVLFFVALSLQYTLKVTSSDRDNRSAFLRWRDQILDLDHGVNIYDEHHYPNPPIMALLLEPLAELPPLAGSLLWFYLKVGMALLIFHWVFRLVESPDRPFPFWAKVLAVLLSLRPLVGDLTHGNVNIFILFLTIAALYCHRCRKDFAAGLLLALAIACKVTPALFVPYFLWKRSWKTLAGCVVGLALSLWLLPGLCLGPDHNAYLLGRWAQQMIVPYLVEGQVTTEHQNQSLPGLVYRLVTDGPSFTEYNGEEYVPVAFHNILSLSPIIPAVFLKLCMAAFAGVVIWCCRASIADRQDRRWAVEFALIVLGMLLFSERTWKHHCVTLILPLTVVLYYLTAWPASERLRRYLLVALLVALVLMATTVTGLFGAAADHAAKLAQVYGAYVWAHVVLAASMIVLLRTRPQPNLAAFQPPHILSFRVRPEEVLAGAEPIAASAPQINPDPMPTSCRRSS